MTIPSTRPGIGDPKQAPGDANQRRPRSWLRRTLITTTTLLLLLAAVIGVNTLRLQSRQVAVTPAPPLAIDMKAAAERLAGGIRIQTISHDRQPPAQQDLERFHNYLTAQFPLTHKALHRETVNGGSLLYTWPGRDPSALPILLAAHQDVAPIAPGTEGQWRHPPFSGTIADGHIWGRGAWDDKGLLLATMEAVERLVGDGFQPQRTIYLAFGHDEETGTAFGQEGARKIAQLLKERNVRLEFVLDEGLLVTQGIMKGLEPPLALIGVAEKGFMTLKLSSQATPGHSSMPPPHTAIGSLAAGLARLERDPMPAALHPVMREMLETVAPEWGGANRVVMSNLWLFEPLVRRQLLASPATAAMMHTTTALTVMHAGEKESILPGHADARVNFRLLPGDSRDHVIAHTQHAIADDSIKVQSAGLAWEATPVSRTDSAAYALINRTIREVFTNALVAPGLMIGGTDSHHYAEVANAIYVFSPVRAGPEDLPRFHGTDERVSIANYEEMIRFYHRLLGIAPAAPGR